MLWDGRSGGGSCKKRVKKLGKEQLLEVLRWRGCMLREVKTIKEEIG